MNGDIDYVVGLLILCEGQVFDLFVMFVIYDVLVVNFMVLVLVVDKVVCCLVVMDQFFQIVLGLQVMLFVVFGKVLFYFEGDIVDIGFVGEQIVGVEFIVNGCRVYYIFGCVYVFDWLVVWILGVDVLLFDGMLWIDDEMVCVGFGFKMGWWMGYVLVFGFEGSMVGLVGLMVGQCIYVYLNNFNFLVDFDSLQCVEVVVVGWQIVYDGMEIML